MTIWINVTTTQNWKGAAVGIVRTELELARGLYLHAPEETRFCRYTDGAFEEVDAKKYLKERFGLATESRAKKPCSDCAVSALRIFSPGDVFLTMGLDWDHGFSHYLFVLRQYRKVRVVTCCYDLIPALYPQWCLAHVAQGWGDYILDVGEGSDCTMCISQCTERDLNRVLNRVGGRVPQTAMIHLGSDGVAERVESEGLGERVQKLLDLPYILYVSTVERRKNHEVIARAYRRILTQHPDMKLPKVVFAGMPGWGVNDAVADMKGDPLTRDLIEFAGRVSDAELAALYRHALFVVFPSLYEGWGLGVAEALAHGKFVLSSDAGSLREVGGSLVWYADPWNVQAWADKIAELVGQPETLSKLERIVRENYRPQRWEDTVKEAARVIDGLKNRPAEKPMVIPDFLLKDLVQESRRRKNGRATVRIDSPLDEISEGGVIVRKKDLHCYQWNCLKWALMRKLAFSEEKRRYYAHKRTLLRRMYKATK